MHRGEKKKKQTFCPKDIFLLNDKGKVSENGGKNLMTLKET